MNYILKNPIRTSQRTVWICVIKANQLMLFEEIVDCYCQKYKKRYHTDILCIKCADFDIITPYHTCITYCELKGKLNALNTKRRLLYLKTQFVPRSKHFSSRL